MVIMLLIDHRSKARPTNGAMSAPTASIPVAPSTTGARGDSNSVSHGITQKLKQDWIRPRIGIWNRMAMITMHQPGYRKVLREASGLVSVRKNASSQQLSLLRRSLTLET